jgi:hypothetical protein
MAAAVSLAGLKKQYEGAPRPVLWFVVTVVVSLAIAIAWMIRKRK